jgi:hypothetical protein
VKRVPIAALAAALYGAPALAQEQPADAKAECAAAYEQSQEKRKAGDLLGAKKELAICVRDVCPEFVRGECAAWREEVEASTPTVVLAAQRGDEDLTDVRVSLDGELLTEQLSGIALPVNPGKRVFVFERSGEPAIQRKVLLRIGEKNRTVSVTFPAPASGAPAEPLSEPVTVLESPAADKKRRQKRTIAYVLAGTSAAALGTFVVFAVTGKNAERDLRDSCSPDCPEQDVSDVRTKYVIADVSLAVSAVSLGAAAWFYFTSRPAPKSEVRARPPALRFEARPAPGGGFVGVTRRF